MPSRKRYNRYPPVFTEVVLRAAKGERICLVCKDANAAKNKRKEFYNYRSALRHAARKEDQEAMKLALLIDDLQFALREQNIIVTSIYSASSDMEIKGDSNVS